MLGMFLWVKLVMSALESLYSEMDIRDAIDILPQEIKALYGYATPMQLY